MPEDIRDKPSIFHNDVTALNFIRSTPPYVLRRHFRQGLRSHIMEILTPLDIKEEQTGVIVDGVRRFPKATPKKMFRIFRSRMATLDSVMTEIGRVKIVERYLAPDFMATSTECIVDYTRPEGRDLLLCGFQEYVDGEILDPWTLLSPCDLLSSLYDTLHRKDGGDGRSKAIWMKTVQKEGERFVQKIKEMIHESGHVPDLAGTGNLILNNTGRILLVDINNISPVNLDDTIYLDEKGYPVCDKSIEALSLVEEKIIGQPVNMEEKIYKWFLTPTRQKSVRAHEERFLKLVRSYNVCPNHHSPHSPQKIKVPFPVQIGRK